MNKQELACAKVLLDMAFAEDIATGDITTNNLIPAQERRTAIWKAKSDGIVAGLEIAQLSFKHLDAQTQWMPKVADGDFVKSGDTIAEINASYRALLSAERIALNFVQRLSGIATSANQYVKAIESTNTRILDTRKTLPAYRLLDKYAVKVGGATNHRMGLYDMVMIKDNHIDIAGGISQAVAQIRSVVAENIKIEVETTNLEQVQEAIDAKADIIMLDNMDIETTKQAVDIIAGRAKTEASGNMSLDRLLEVAKTGIDYISVGALTHSVKAFDISQRIVS